MCLLQLFLLVHSLPPQVSPHSKMVRKTYFIHTLLPSRIFFSVPSSPPEQFNTSADSSSTLQLQWNPPSSLSVNGIIQHYIITVYEVETDTIFQSTTSTSTQLSVSGLHPYYIYTCSISAVTIGSGPVMNITIQMPEDGEC